MAAIFGESGLAQIRVRLGKSLGQPEYWQELTASELEAVLLYLDEAENLEDYAEWERAAYLVAELRNMFCEKKPNKEPWQIEEVIPVKLPGEGNVEPEPKKQDLKDMLKIMEQLKAGMKRR